MDTMYGAIGPRHWTAIRGRPDDIAEFHAGIDLDGALWMAAPVANVGALPVSAGGSRAPVQKPPVMPGQVRQRTPKFVLRATATEGEYDAALEPSGTSVGRVGKYDLNPARRGSGTRWWAKPPGEPKNFGRFETAKNAAQWLCARMVRKK